MIHVRGIRTVHSIMTKKYRLSPFQREVMVMLGDAGEESLLTMLIMLGKHYPDLSGNEIIINLEGAVRELNRLGLVQLYVEQEQPIRELIPLYDKQHVDALAFNRMVRHELMDDRYVWTSNDFDEDTLYLVLTDLGEDALTS